MRILNRYRQLGQQICRNSEDMGDSLGGLKVGGAGRLGFAEGDLWVRPLGLGLTRERRNVGLAGLGYMLIKIIGKMVPRSSSLVPL